MTEEEGFGTKKLKVEIGRSAELEQLRKEKDDRIKALELELEEKKSIIEQEAMAELEKEKKAVLELLNQSDLSYEQRAAIEDKLESPANMELVKAMLGVKSTKKHDPYGKAGTFNPPTGAGSSTQLLNELYEKLSHPSRFEKQEVIEAKKQRDTLLSSLLEGPSWSSLKESGTKSLEKQTLFDCPKCGFTMVNEEKCSNCGEDWSPLATRQRKSMRTWTYRGEKQEG